VIDKVKELLAYIRENHLADCDVSDTVYDDVIRTTCERHIQFLIPLVNRFLNTSYSKDAKVELMSDTHHDAISSQMHLRVTDAYFRITEDGTTRNYHLECQSSADATMIVRIVEYDFMIALDNMAKQIEMGQYESTLEFPETVVLYLRHSESMPDSFKVHLKYGTQSMDYEVPIVKAQTFSLEELAEGELYMLIPFYLMRYEKQIKSGTDLELVEREIRCLMATIRRLRETGKLSAYQEQELIGYSQKVLLKLAESSNESEKERLVECMSGQVIETEAHLLYVAGKEEGREDGRNEGIQITKAVIRLDAEGYAVSDIATELSISEDEVKQILE
jgi:hypothetical protein